MIERTTDTVGPPARALAANNLYRRFSFEVIHVNPGLFAFTYLLGLPAVVHLSLLALPFGEGLNAPPSNEDIGVLAARVLEDPDPYIGLDQLADAVVAATPEGRRHSRAVMDALPWLPNALLVRAAAVAGRVHIRWDARRTEIVVADCPSVDSDEASHELARRFLHWLGPASSAHFAKWAGVPPGDAERTWETLVPDIELPPLPAAHEPDEARGTTTRLLNSLTGRIALDGMIVGAWGRAKTDVTIDPWPSLPEGRIDDVDAEARSLGAPIGADPRAVVAAKSARRRGGPRPHSATSAATAAVRRSSSASVVT